MPLNIVSHSQHDHETKVFHKVLTASLLSSLLVSVLTAIIIGSVLSMAIRTSYFGPELFNLPETVTDPSIVRFKTEADIISQSRGIANLLTFLFWFIVGTFVYVLLSSIKNLFNNLADLNEQSKYIHADKAAIKKAFFGRLLVRILVGLIWALYGWTFSNYLLPYVLAAARSSTAEIGIFKGAGYLLSALCLCWLFLHIHVILMRLLALKIRVFSDTADL